MKNYVMIVSNDKNKTLTLTLPHNLSNGNVVGPYLAMYQYLHEGYKWVNWFDWNKNKVGLENIKQNTTSYYTEEYVNSIIVNGEIDDNWLMDIIEELGYIPNYIFQSEKRQIELIYIKCKDYVCGKGSYFYDKQNLNSYNIKPNLIYEGEYLRCILDAQNNIKSGILNIEDQEILIPFHIKL